MMDAYRSGDPYLAFAKQAGAAPPEATKATHKAVREQFKQCVLAVTHRTAAHTRPRAATPAPRNISGVLGLVGPGRGLRHVDWRPARCLIGSLSVAENIDPWRLTLERVRGKIDFYDGLERVSSQMLLDLLEVPQRSRTAGTFRRLSRAMTELGWTAVRVRDLTRGGYLVRGYCRQPRTLQAGH
jgi:hypothetical protein